MTTRSAPWIDAMRGVLVADVASALGYDVAPATATARAIVYACPSCGATRERRGSAHVRHGGRGVGTSRDGRGWRCFACDASGDALDFVALARGSRRYRDLADTARAEVREWCVRFVGGAPSTTSPARTAPASHGVQLTPPDASPDAPSYPPLAELRATWQTCSRVDTVPEVAAYLRRRGIDPTAVADLDLARAVTPRTTTHAWASIGRTSWRASHRLLVPLRDARGAARSLLARSIDPAAERKSLAPRGYSRAGLVMACPVARRMLAHGIHPSAWPVDTDDGAPFAVPPLMAAGECLTVVICEGEIDFLAAATEWSDAAEHAPATLGIVQGAWSRDLAARIPDGASVMIATDPDDAGEKYARTIADSLRGRRVDILRRRAPTTTEAA